MASGIATEKKTPLFRSVDKKKQLTENPMNRNDVLRMIKRRAKAAGLPYSTCCDTFRATGHHRLLREWRHDRERAGDRGSRVAAHH